MKKGVSFLALCTGLVLAGEAVAASKLSEKIDDLLAKSYAAHGVEPNAPASDEVFVRRIYLDVAGRVPTKEEAEFFLNSKAKDKRSVLIDQLLDSEGYVNHFYNFWADVLRVNTRANNSQVVFPAYAAFVKDSLRENKSYDRFVRELITANGDAWDNGAIGYYMRDRGMPLDNMSNTVRVFLGTRLECAQCHDHPFDKWSQMDYYQMAAFSYGMRATNYSNEQMRQAGGLVRKMVDDRSKERDMRRAFNEIQRPLRYTSVTKSETSLPRLPHDYQYSDAKPEDVVRPRTMFGKDIELTAEDRDKDRLEVYAQWLTSDENPRFTTVIANRLWKKAFGRALIEPLDEMMDGSEASHPELMAFLEKRMEESGYDMKGFLRMIFNTDAYQREATTEEVGLADVYQFQGPMLRRMSAEQIWDSVVTLVNPDPDAIDVRGMERAYERLENTRKMAAVMDSQSPRELAKAAIRIGELQRDLQKDYDALQKRITQAREAGEDGKARRLSSEANSLRNQVRSSVQEEIYEPVMKKMGEDDQGMAGAYSMYGGVSAAEARKEREALRKEIEMEMDAMGLDNPSQRKGYYSFRMNVGERVKRAANMESPAPRGHFLRQFGQSDRETIENANYDASVPQALELMNGDTFKMVMNPYSALVTNVKREVTPQDRVDAIFMSLLSRPADADERRMLVAAVMEGGDDVYEDIVHSLLNTSQFLFIQ
ncbi:MAG: DUF1549 domain-containing protein [Verrucomicrobiota bacterium]